MLPALSRALDKFNIFFLSLMIATTLGAESFANFAIAMSYALICFSIIEVGGQQLYNYFNANIKKISPDKLNQLKVFVFVLLLPCLFFIDSWQLVCVMALGYLFESLNNSFRFKLFDFGYYSKEASVFLSERLIIFLAIAAIFLLNYFSVGFVTDLISMFTFILLVKMSFFMVNRLLSNKIDVLADNYGLDEYINYLMVGKYFIFSAFIASLFMQIDILVLNWLDADGQEIALISALLRLVTATFFIATVFQQFILPKFQILLANKEYYLKYERYVSYFAFFLTAFLIFLCDVYLSIFFGVNMSNDSKILNVSLLLLLVFTRFTRDPVSLYLGQSGKNKAKVKIIAILLPIKVLALYFGYLYYGFFTAISVVVLFDSLIYLLFRYVIQFKIFVFSYWVGIILLMTFIYIIELLPLPARISVALFCFLSAFILFSKITKLGVSFK
jgi:O-antigen/teichoic acid export membrane protein